MKKFLHQVSWYIRAFWAEFKEGYREGIREGGCSRRNFHVPRPDGVCLDCDKVVLVKTTETTAPALIIPHPPPRRNLRLMRAFPFVAVALLLGCGPKTEQRWVNDNVDQCGDECTDQHYNKSDWTYWNQTFVCRCYHYNQPWGTIIFSKRFTAK